jgi:hypothetical protein
MASVVQDMLTAAEQAAGAKWNDIRPDVTSFAEQLVQQTAQTATDLASGAISKAEGKVEFDQMSDFSAIVADYAQVALRAVLQAAFNAAVDVLWKAIEAKIPIV